jgi:hypothetical protein
MAGMLLVAAAGGTGTISGTYAAAPNTKSGGMVCIKHS